MQGATAKCSRVNFKARPNIQTGIHITVNIFAAAMNVASTRFKADKGIMDALVLLRKKRGTGGRAGGSNGRRVSPGDAALGHALC